VGGLAVLVAAPGSAATMTSKPKTVPDQHRDMVAELKEWVLLTTDNEPGAHAVNATEQAIRLAGFALALLTKHRPDKQGYCTRCQPYRTGWRARLPHRSRKNPCMAWKAARLFLLTDPAVATWQALRFSGDNRDLADIREMVQPV
jgi:uncharacterized protein YhdP